MEQDAPIKRRGSLWGRLMKFGLPLAISVGLCYALFHGMNFGEMVDFVRRDCDFRWICLSVAIGVAGFMFRALRWRIQLRASGIKVPVAPMFYSIVGTYAVNIVVPRMGEVWRSEYIARRQNAPFATVFGSMIAERASDTLAVLLLMLTTMLVGGHHLRAFLEQKFDTSGMLYNILMSPWTYVAGVALVLLLALLMRVHRSSSPVQRILGILRELMAGFLSIFHMKGAWKWLILTGLLWGSYYMQMWACFNAFALTRELMATDGHIVVLLCFVMGSLSMGVPSNGGIGPYQIAVVFGLQCFAPDINLAQGYSFANVVLGSQTLLTIVLGLYAFLAIALEKKRLEN